MKKIIISIMTFTCTVCKETKTEIIKVSADLQPADTEQSSDFPWWSVAVIAAVLVIGGTVAAVIIIIKKKNNVM